MNLERVQVKRSYCRYYKSRHSAGCHLAHAQISSLCLALPPQNQAKFIAGLTTHSSLILHTNLQGKVAAHPGWDLGFFCALEGKKVWQIVHVMQCPLMQRLDVFSFKMFIISTV